MTFLPIVQRELLVATRRKGTYRIRFWTALIAMIVSLLMLPMTYLIRGRTSGGGEILFATLSYYFFGLTLLAGVFLTFDALSEEKREGTLGLLFLTDLTGYDIVLGKFFARSLNAFYALLALFPIMALPILMGGVTGGEFWRMTLALTNSLFVALAGSLGVSAVSSDPQKTLSRALLGILVVAGLLPLLESVLGAGRPWAGFSLFWPFYYAFERAFTPEPAQFWKSLVCSHLVGWGFLAWASYRLPRCWQSEAVAAIRTDPSVLTRFFPRSKLRRPPLRDSDPLLWLVTRTSFGPVYIWLVVGLIVVALLIFEFTGQQFGSILGRSVVLPLQYLLKIFVAAQAGRFFIETRRSGGLEMLLCTPLPGSSWVESQWVALRRTFGAPFLVFAAASLWPAVAHFIPIESLSPFYPHPTSGGISVLELFSTTYGLIKFFTDVYAVAWTAMWLALSTKNPNYAVAWAILFVLVLPVFAFCIPDPLIDLMFINWARRNLRADPRLVMQRQMEIPLRPAAPVPKPSQVPPILTT